MNRRKKALIGLGAAILVLAFAASTIKTNKRTGPAMEIDDMGPCRYDTTLLPGVVSNVVVMTGDSVLLFVQATTRDSIVHYLNQVHDTAHIVFTKQQYHQLGIKLGDSIQCVYKKRVGGICPKEVFTLIWKKFQTPVTYK